MRDELTELFAPYDPEHVHEHIEPAEMAKILGAWKPRWIHAERSRELVRAIIAEAGFDPGYTYYDVPKPRTSFPSGHLTTGIAFAFPWHRDVWYSAPAQQINWWLPVFPVRETNAMSFDLASFARAVPNTSGDFDYYQNNARRLGTAKSGGQGAPGASGRDRPHAERGRHPAPRPWRGPAVLRRAAAHLRSRTPRAWPGTASTSARSTPATSRAGTGAPLVDAYCTGTAIRDFVSVKDESAFDEDLVRSIYGEPPADAMLVFGGSKVLAHASRR